MIAAPVRRGVDGDGLYVPANRPVESLFWFRGRWLSFAELAAARAGAK